MDDKFTYKVEGGADNKIVIYFIIILIAVILFTLLAVIVSQKALSSDLKATNEKSNTENILGNNISNYTLSEADTSLDSWEVTSFSATYYNRTWLEFDGLDDVLIIANKTYTTVSFWYRNDTTDWQNIINSSGTIYVNGSEADPLLYPVFFNNSDYLFGKLDSSTFLDVGIDEIRFYNGTINSTTAEGIYNAGR